jgi:hypothetical protein
MFTMDNKKEINIEMKLKKSSIENPIKEVSKSDFKISDKNIKKYLEKYKIYFDKNNSFYKTYNSSIYNELISLENDIFKLNNIFESELFATCEKNLIPYLKNIHFINFQKKENIEKLENILSSIVITGFVPPSSHLINDINVALSLEKYFKDTLILCNKCPSYPDSLTDPIFDPCKYPNIIILYEHFLDYCYDQRHLHSLAGSYYSYMNKCFLIPSLLFASIGASFSFLSATCFFSERMSSIMAIIVGIMSCAVALFQSFISAYGFDTKASHFNRAAELYDQQITIIDFEKSYPSNNQFFKDLEKELVKIKSNCPFLIPTTIKKNYYKKKDKKAYESFIRKMIIDPGRKELMEAIHSGNKKLTINNNMDFIQQKIIEINKLENTLIDINPNIKRTIDENKLINYPLQFMGYKKQ